MAIQRSTTPVPIDPDAAVDFDLDVLVVEAEDAPPFRFKWGGKTFEMPLMMAMPFSDQLALESATTEESMRLVMGPGMFDELVSTPGGADERPLSIGRMRMLLEEWNKHQGLESGESPASSRSSGSTARPSRPTSRSARRR